MIKSTTNPVTPSRPYPRFPPPKIMALLLNPFRDAKHYVFLRPTKKGLREFFGDVPVTFTNDYAAGYRIYHQVDQSSPEYGYYAHPNPGAAKYRGKVLLTSLSGKELSFHVGTSAMKVSALFFGKIKYD